MKRLLILIPAIVFLAGCTASDPAYTSVVNEVDVDLASDEELRILGRTGDDTYQVLGLDADTHALTTITHPHHEVHAGNSFVASSVDEAMIDDAVILLVFKTMSAPKRMHLFLEFETLVGGDLRVWEGATWTTNTGGLLPIINRNRETTMNDSGILEDKTASPAFTATNNMLEKPAGLNTAAATSIHRHYTWGQKNKLAAGGIRETEEFMLKADTQYAIVFTADGGANKAQIWLNWYEHTDEEP